MAKSRDYSEIQPHIQFLADHAVLVQAWKKAHAYIRSHNWYADSLELDVSAIRLRELIEEWSSELNPQTIDEFAPKPMRLVTAPKAAPWSTSDGWNPENTDDLRLRPLAHIAIQDQTYAMAVLICLADLVETEQGDPRLPLNVENQKRVVSYGHRLVARWDGESAHFQWGNAKLYRQYFEDYQQFVRRPERIRQELFENSDKWAIVQIDLSRFYDLIPRDDLLEKLKALCDKARRSHQIAHKRFFETVTQLFDWSWHDDDAGRAQEICGNEEGVGLPQGLAASGFFANAYLLDFDSYMVSLFGRRLKKRNWQVMDYCRYVDDMRFVIRFDDETPDDFRNEFEAMVERQLKKHAPGLLLNKKKTQIMYGDSHSSNVPVAEAMQSVNTNVSGPLDVETARHALEMLDGLLAVSNSRKNQPTPEGTGHDELLKRVLAVEPDVRNDTLERFVAHRWRRVYRTLRVMAEDENITDSTMNVGRKVLDQRARTFSVELLRKWILDPSNVRILRVSLDLFPVPDHLEIVTSLLQSHLDKDDDRDKCRLTAQYVASEILRAGATETGFVRDNDELPNGTDIGGYREMLTKFARGILDNADDSPWYLRQQALLFLAVMQKPVKDYHETTKENRHYGYLHDLLGGGWPKVTAKRSVSADIAVPLCLVAHRVSGGAKSISTALAKWIERTSNSRVQSQLRYIVEFDDLYTAALSKLPTNERTFWRNLASATGYSVTPSRTAWAAVEKDETAHRLVDIITSEANPFQQETAAIRLLSELSKKWGAAKDRKNAGEGTLTPARVLVICTSWQRLADPGDNLADVKFEVQISPEPELVDERFAVPSWCRSPDRWKYEVGQVLRAAVIGKTDYTQPFLYRPVVPGVTKYRGVSSGWFKRKHGLFNDRQGLGHRLMPVSPWLAELLGRLLEWPGSRQRRELVKLPSNYSAAGLRRVVADRLSVLDGLYCRLSGLPLYPFPVPSITENGKAGQLKVALVQTALPTINQLASTTDPTLSDPATRRQHRRHLSAMLRLCMKMTEVREGYKNEREPIDIVLLPELSVHPEDIFLLERFADSLKCMVFCGLVFHPKPENEDDLINSGLWILPIKTSDGRSIRFLEQGKYHMTANEKKLGIAPFRPCQWLVEYRSTTSNPFRLSSAICYDATDLGLAADLKEHTDAFIVSALNKDIGTFDAMVTALHYHMYQHVLLVNSAEFGGSTAQAPYKDHFRKVIMHHHGADQATVSVFTIDLKRFRSGSIKTKPEIKYPPAGLGR